MSTPTAVIDGYDAALFDLDGVVYLGPVAVPGAVEGLVRLRARGTQIGYVTNNAARPPQAVAAHLEELGIPCTPADVVTSAQAGAVLLRRRFGAGARVLVVGGAGVRAALAEADLIGVDSADDDPVAVIQGYAPDLAWAQLDEAAIAIGRGAHWLATNTDTTRPTDRGLVPGNGAAVAAVRSAVGVQAEVAGKPYRPLLDVTVERLGSARPIFVGDRVDTDIAGAVAAGLDSLLVLTGAHGVRDLLAAGTDCRPTYLGFDLRDLLKPPRTVELSDSWARCGEMAAEAGTEVTLVSRPSGRDQQLDALWAVARLCWATSTRPSARLADALPDLPGGTLP